MKYTLSKEAYSTFVGDVYPLWVKIENKWDISEKDIRFSTESDGILLRDFRGDEKFSFSNGVLITVLKSGDHVVNVSVGNSSFSHTLHAHPMRRATSEQATGFYLGDMHTHTSMIHGSKEFAERTQDFYEDYFAEIKKENLLDFGVISDHAETINDKDFFQ